MKAVLQGLDEDLTGLGAGSHRLLDESDGHTQHVHSTLIVTCREQGQRSTYVPVRSTTKCMLIVREMTLSDLSHNIQ